MPHHWRPDKADHGGRRALPFTLSPGRIDDLSAFLAWLREGAGLIETLLGNHGAVLVRDTPLCSPPHLSQAAEALGAPLLPWPGGERGFLLESEHLATAAARPRPLVAGPLFSAHLHPPELVLLLFLVDAPPPRSLLLLDLEELARQLPAALAHSLGDASLVHHLRTTPPPGPGGRRRQGFTLKELFGSEDPERVEALLHRSGATWTWAPNGRLDARWESPPFRTHPQRGTRVFHNPLCGGGGLDTTHTDGAAVRSDHLQALAERAEDLAIGLDWRPGDLVLLDNLRIGHAQEGATTAALAAGRRRLAGPQHIGG